MILPVALVLWLGAAIPAGSAGVFQPSGLGDLAPLPGTAARDTASSVEVPPGQLDLAPATGFS